MDYEKAYKEALERAKSFQEKYGGDYAGYIFPELRESEDEIHRKWILEYLYDGLRKADEQFKDHFKSAINWLEKQKEQKPDTRDSDDLQLIGFVYDLLNEIEWNDNWAMSKDACLRRLNNYRPQKPAEWSEDLKEAAEKYAYNDAPDELKSLLKPIADEVVKNFIAGAEWQKAKMMEEAVEGEVCGRVYDHINIRFADGICKYLEPKNISHIPADVSKYNIGDKVKIIVKEDEQ